MFLLSIWLVIGRSLRKKLIDCCFFLISGICLLTLTLSISHLIMQITQFLDSHGFLDYLERGAGPDESITNLLDKLQDALGRGQNPMSVLPSSTLEPEIITISDSEAGISGGRS